MHMSVGGRVQGVKKEEGGAGRISWLLLVVIGMPSRVIKGCNHGVQEEEKVGHCFWVWKVLVFFSGFLIYCCLT